MMEHTFRNYAGLVLALSALFLISCGGGGQNFTINADNDFPPFSDFPPVSNTDFEAGENLYFEVQPENSSRLRLEGVGGNVTITGISGSDSVTITAAKRVRSDSPQDAEEQLHELLVNVQNSATEVFVETIEPQNKRGRIYVIDYVITLPSYWEVQVTNVSGAVALTSIDNDVTVDNVIGNVSLMDIAGSAMVKLVSGIIESNVILPVNGTIDFKTVTGDISLAIPVDTSAQFTATVNTGSISVSNLALWNEVRTSSRVSGMLGIGQGTISLKTEAIGDIAVSGF